MEINQLINLCDTYAQKRMVEALTEYEVEAYEAACRLIKAYCDRQRMILEKEDEDSDQSEGRTSHQGAESPSD